MKKWLIKGKNIFLLSLRNALSDGWVTWFFYREYFCGNFRFTPGDKNIQKNLKIYVRFFSIKIKKKKKIPKNLQKKTPKKFKKILPRLAKKKNFPIKLKISTNLFSIKIKINIFFLGLGEKKFIKNLKSLDCGA